MNRQLTDEHLVVCAEHGETDVKPVKFNDRDWQPYKVVQWGCSFKEIHFCDCEYCESYGTTVACERTCLYWQLLAPDGQKVANGERKFTEREMQRLENTGAIAGRSAWRELPGFERGVRT